jgi:hypothetical protein
MTCCIITTDLYIIEVSDNNRPLHFIIKALENVSEKEPIFADEGATVRALLRNKNAEKYVFVFVSCDICITGKVLYN